MVQSAKTPHGGVAWPSIPPILSAAASLQASRGRVVNTTGFTNFEPSLTGKWFELLKEIAPGIVRVAVIFNPKTAPGEGSLFPWSVRGSSSLIRSRTDRGTRYRCRANESALAAIWREPGGGLIVMPDAFTTIHRKAIIALGAQHCFPAIYPYRYEVVDGGLMSYGVDTIDLLRRAASYVDRILKREKPKTLPCKHRSSSTWS